MRLFGMYCMRSCIANEYPSLWAVFPSLLPAVGIIVLPVAHETVNFVVIKRSVANDIFISVIVGFVSAVIR